MKKMIFLLFAVLLFASNNPFSDGTYYGNIKVKITDKYFYSYPSNSYAYATKLYLYKKNKKYYAVDNIRFDVKITKNVVYVFADYNVLVYNN